MKFADENAENKFIELNEKYGLNHISSCAEITSEDLEILEVSLKKCSDNYSEEV